MTALAPRLYERAPAWLQTAAVSAYGAWLGWQRFGGEFPALLAEAEASTFASPEALAAGQERRWAEVVGPAVAKVEAYGRRPLALADLPGLPILDKAELRAHLARYQGPPLPRRQLVRAHTSGTTGAGLRFTTTLHAHRRQWAFWWRYRGWHGIRRGEWCAVFGGRSVVPPAATEPPFWQVNHATRTVLFSQYHLTRARAPRYLEEIRRRGIRWIHGYPSLVGLLARAALEARVELPVRWVTLGAENLLAGQRRDIQAAFGVAPRQHYGMAEGVANFSECPEGRLHVDEDYALVELLPDGRGGHRVVGTTLDNAALPLLRYDVGDVVRLGSGPPCPCRRPGRWVESIDGRSEDYLLLSDGSFVGRVDHLFKDAVRVVEAQIVQRRAGEAVFRVVRGPGWTAADEEALRGEAAARFGGRLRVAFDYADSLPRTPAGKLRLVVSELQEGKLGG